MREFCGLHGFEIVEDHKYKTVIRIESGVLLYINKSRTKEEFRYETFWNMKRDYPKQFKKVAGIPKCYEFTTNAKSSYKQIEIEKGTIVFDGRAVTVLEPKDYTYELAISGGRYCGNKAEVEKLHKNIVSIMDFMTGGTI